MRQPIRIHKVEQSGNATHIVVRNRTVFLRVVRGHFGHALALATEVGDDKGYWPCKHAGLLAEAAALFVIDLAPETVDVHCLYTFEASPVDDELAFRRELLRVAKDFFACLDCCSGGKFISGDPVLNRRKATISALIDYLLPRGA